MALPTILRSIGSSRLTQATPIQIPKRRVEDSTYDRADSDCVRKPWARNDDAPTARRRPAQTIAGQTPAFLGEKPIEEWKSATPPSGYHGDSSGAGTWVGALIVVTLCLGWTPPTGASETNVLVAPLAAMGEEGWQPLTFRNIERKTEYELSRDPSGRPAYRAISQCSASAMLLRLPKDFDLARTPRLAWRWRIETGLENHHEQKRVGDDFAARVYVLFRFDSDHASSWQRLRNELGRRLFDLEIPGRAISYVWASRVSRGEYWTSPSQEGARLLVLESASDEAASQRWHEEVVDLAVDVMRLFDQAPHLQPYALGLMTDADDTCENATAWFSDFRLMGPESKAPTSAEIVIP